MIDKTERGFSIYGEFIDTYGATIRVQESSAVGPQKIWIYCTGGGTVKNDKDANATAHLNIEQMKKLRDILDTAIKDSESPENWRNNMEYIDVWGRG